MLTLPEKNYSILKQVLELLGFSEEDQKRVIEEFERSLLTDLAGAVARKLPEHEQKEFIEFLNSSLEKDLRSEIEDKVSSWMNEEEIFALFQKVADKAFADLLPDLYKKATEEQKKRLEEMFKKEVLRG